MRKLYLKLDLQLFSQEKTEKASPKKRRDARNKGQTAKSSEIPSALVMLFGFLALMIAGHSIYSKMMSLFVQSYRTYMLWDVTQENVLAIFGQLLYQGILLLAPIMLVIMVVAVVGNYVQVGFLLTGEPLKMKLSKLNPLEGAKRIFSLRALVDFFKSLLKLLIIAGVVFLTLWGDRSEIISLSGMPLESIFIYVAKLTLSLGIKIGVILTVLGLFDYFYQKYEYEKGLRMSKQDLKDEFKNSEGDPFIKGKIREKQRRMAIQRMMQEIPKADVVITNPTHFAIALQYDSGTMAAPKVVAKGMDYIALKIKEIAKENGVITMENRPLARALYEQVEIGESIPAEMFQAVAEVLAYVYKIKRKA